MFRAIFDRHAIELTGLQTLRDRSNIRSLATLPVRFSGRADIRFRLAAPDY